MKSFCCLDFVSKFALVWIMGTVAHAKMVIKSEKSKFDTTVVNCDGTRAQSIKVGSSQIVVLDFIMPPKEVIPSKNVFLIRAIKSDLVIKPQAPGSRSLLVVYVENKRCVLDLVTVPTKSNDVYLIRDPKDSIEEVHVHGI